MLTVERREFTSTLNRQGGLAVDALSSRTLSALSERGVDTTDLRDVAGADGVIRGEELDQLFDAITRGRPGDAVGEGRHGDIMRSDRLWAALRADAGSPPTAPLSTTTGPSGRDSTGLRGSIFGTRRTEIAVDDPPVTDGTDDTEAAAATSDAPEAPDSSPEAEVAEVVDPAAHVDRTDAARAIIEAHTRSVVGTEDAEAFRIVDEANRHTESGGRPRYSTLRTTAGFPASYGEGQLVVRDHLTELAGLSDSELESLGLDRATVEDMQRHGRAAEAFYDLANGTSRTRERAAQLRDAGLTEAEATDLARLTRAGDYEAIEARFGERFAERTGLPASEIRALAETSVLRRPDLRAEWARTFERVHGHEFDPDNRNNDEIRAATEAFVADHPELEGLRDRIGNVSMGYYLGRGDTAENSQGWYARAAAGTMTRGEFDALMADVDPVTTRLRHLRNFERGREAVDATGATGAARTELIGRIARQFHGAPGFAREHFLPDGHARFHSEAALRTDLAELAPRRAASDRAFLRNYREVVGH